MRGFTLVEVLVALVVLSLGLLGASRLQYVGLRHNHQTFLRGQAIVLAESMADRMLANSDGTNSGYYDSADDVNYQDPADNTCVEHAGTAALDCDALQMAAHDAFDWNLELAQRLPSGAGVVCIDSDPSDANPCDGAGDVYSITVNWTELTPDGPAAATYTRRFER